MAERGQKGCQNTSDDGVNEILEGFVLTPKIDGVMDTDVSAGHTCTYVIYVNYMYVNYIHVVHIHVNLACSRLHVHTVHTRYELVHESRGK